METANDKMQWSLSKQIAKEEQFSSQQNATDIKYY